MNTPILHDHAYDLLSRDDRRQSRRSCRKEEKHIPILRLITIGSAEGCLAHPATRDQKERNRSLPLQSASKLDKMDRGNHPHLIAEVEGSASRWSGPSRLEALMNIRGTYSGLLAEMVIKGGKCAYLTE